MLSLKDIDELEKGRKEAKTQNFKPTLKPRDNRIASNSTASQDQPGPSTSSHAMSASAPRAPEACSLQPQHHQQGERAGKEAYAVILKKGPDVGKVSCEMRRQPKHASLITGAPTSATASDAPSKKPASGRSSGKKPSSTSVAAYAGGELSTAASEHPREGPVAVAGSRMAASASEAGIAGPSKARGGTATARAAFSSVDSVSRLPSGPSVSAVVAVVEGLDLPGKRQRRFAPATATGQPKHPACPSVHPTVPGVTGSRQQTPHDPPPVVPTLDSSFIRAHLQPNSTARGATGGDLEDGDTIASTAEALVVAFRQQRASETALSSLPVAHSLSAQEGGIGPLGLTSGSALITDASLSARHSGQSSVGIQAAAAAVEAVQKPTSSIDAPGPQHRIPTAADTPPRRRPRKPLKPLDTTAHLVDGAKPAEVKAGEKALRISSASKPQRRQRRNEVFVGTDVEASHAGIQAVLVSGQPVEEGSLLGSWIGGILGVTDGQAGDLQSSGESHSMLL